MLEATRRSTRTKHMAYQLSALRGVRHHAKGHQSSVWSDHRHPTTNYIPAGKTKMPPPRAKAIKGFILGLPT